MQVIRTEAMVIIRSLVERAVMHPIDKSYEIELVGDIANMIGPPRKPRSQDHDAFDSSVCWSRGHAASVICSFTRYGYESP